MRTVSFEDPSVGLPGGEPAASWCDPIGRSAVGRAARLSGTGEQCGGSPPGQATSPPQPHTAGPGAGWRRAPREPGQCHARGGPDSSNTLPVWTREVTVDGALARRGDLLTAREAPGGGSRAEPSARRPEGRGQALSVAVQPHPPQLCLRLTLRRLLLPFAEWSSCRSQMSLARTWCWCRRASTPWRATPRPWAATTSPPDVSRACRLPGARLHPAVWPACSVPRASPPQGPQKGAPLQLSDQRPGVELGPQKGLEAPGPAWPLPPSTLGLPRASRRDPGDACEALGTDSQSPSSHGSRAARGGQCRAPQAHLPRAQGSAGRAQCPSAPGQAASTCLAAFIRASRQPGSRRPWARGTGKARASWCDTGWRPRCRWPAWDWPPTAWRGSPRTLI